MNMIRTVTGDIAPGEAGRTYMHEHLLWSPPEPFAGQDPDLGLDSVDAALKEVGAFGQAGGSTLVEMTTPELKRNPAALRAISTQTGVHIVAATGYNKGKFSDPAVADLSVDDIAAMMIRDVGEGMDGTGIRAGVIKASTSRDHATDGERKVIAAAGIAHRATGAPVSTHTEAGTFAREQVAMLRAAGVPPERMLIGHLDRNLDPDLHLALAGMGVYLGFDQIGKEKYAPDRERIAMIERLVEAGHGRQIMLSGDMARKSNWPSSGFGYGPGLTYILWRFVPWMLKSGIPREAVEWMLVDNPAVFLSFGQST